MNQLWPSEVWWIFRGKDRRSRGRLPQQCSSSRESAASAEEHVFSKDPWIFGDVPGFLRFPIQKMMDFYGFPVY